MKRNAAVVRIISLIVSLLAIGMVCPSHFDERHFKDLPLDFSEATGYNSIDFKR